MDAFPSDGTLGQAAGPSKMLENKQKSQDNEEKERSIAAAALEGLRRGDIRDTPGKVLGRTTAFHGFLHE